MLTLSAISPSDADELRQAVARLQDGDPLRPVSVVCPDVYAAASLRQRLGLSGFANLRFIVFDRLAARLGEPRLEAQRKSPLTPVLRGAIARGVIADAGGALSDARDHPSTIASLTRTFTQMRRSTPAALDRIAAASDLQREVVGLYRRYRNACEGYHDSEDRAAAAVEALRDGSAADALQDIGDIVLYRPRRLAPSQRRLAAALAKAGKCAAMLGLTGDGGADRETLEFADEIADAIGVARPPLPDAAPPQPVKAICAAPNAHQEIRWVLRQLTRRAAEGVPFHKMAVMYRQQAPYGTLIREELELADIPVAGPSAESLADTAVGRALLGVIAFSDASVDFARGDVMEWLTGCPLKAPPAQDGSPDPNFSPSLWDSISKRAGVVRGADQWRQRLDSFADENERQANSGIGRGERELSPGEIQRLRADVAAARKMRYFINGVADRAKPPGGGFAPADWSAFCEWAKGLLDRYVLPDERLPPNERRARASIARAIDELAAAEQVRPQATFDDFRRALNETLQAPLGHLQSVGQGVFVAPFRRAAGMSFDIGFIVGMVEGAVPTPPRDDPLVPDALRGDDAAMPTMAQQRDEERGDYLAALATAPAFTLTYPVADSAAGRAAYPSRWLLDAASKLAEKQVFASDLPSFTSEVWYTAIESMQWTLDALRDDAKADNPSYADAHDYNLERLHTWKREGRALAHHPLVADGALAAAIRLADGRNSSAFTAWDGNLSGGGAANALPTDRPLSPTALERYATCPFSYFLANLLYLGAEEDPEDIYEISPLERGSLVHDILDEFIREAIQAGSAPDAGSPWTDAHRQKLMAIAEAKFQDAEDRGVVGKRLMWRLTKDEIANDLNAFLDADARMRAKFGVVTAHTEAMFGYGGATAWDAPEYALPGASRARFRGSIDRVDASPNAKTLLVLDYKTGGSYRYRNLDKDPIDKGKHLQLAIYSLAAQRNIPGASDVRAAYWFVTNRGNFDTRPKEPLDANAPAVKGRFADGVAVIVNGIRAGLFPANPDGDDNQRNNCAYCDFKTLCPSRRQAMWERKSAAQNRAPEMREYARLAADDYEPENKDPAG